MDLQEAAIRATARARMVYFIVDAVSSGYRIVRPPCVPDYWQAGTLLRLSRSLVFANSEFDCWPVWPASQVEGVARASYDAEALQFPAVVCLSPCSPKARLLRIRPALKRPPRQCGSGARPGRWMRRCLTACPVNRLASPRLGPSRSGLHPSQPGLCPGRAPRPKAPPSSGSSTPISPVIGASR